MLKFVEDAPQRVVRIGDVQDAPDLGPEMSAQDVDQIAEIFHTPLTGAYSWDYHEADKKLRKPGRPATSELSEVEQLRLKLAKAEQELAILKKFDAYLTRLKK